MPNTVNAGWLKDKNGDKFAPKTLTSQVQTNDGTLIEDKIKADIDRVADKIVQSDWNADEDEAGHVLNRTHYVEKPFDSITWNGDIAGKEEIVYNQNKSYYKVSDRILSVDDLLGAICKNSNGSSVTITEKRIMQPNENIIFLKLIGDIFVLSPTTYDGMTFNSSGVYIQRNVSGDYVSYTTEIIARDVVHKLEEKYIPDSIAKVGTAEVGQTIVVKSVDENGKPTAWEAEDFPECDVTSVNGQTGDVQTRLLVMITANEDGIYTSSHTSQEIYAATQAGAVVEASDANGKRYSLYTCNEKGAQFLTMGVRGSSGKRILYTESFVISSNKVGKGTTETPIPVASVPMVGATGTAAGTAGLVPKPAAGEQGKYLKGDGTWANIDCVQNPNTAAVGQVITVKAIDENGKVTETVGSNLATDEDTMDLLSELGAVTPVTTSSGEVLTNNAGEIYTL